MPEQPPEPTVADPRAKPRDETRSRRLPPYHVVIANDDDHSMDFVIGVLRKVLGAPMEHAMQLMLEAHSSGRAVIWTGPKEVAELKAEQVQTFHEVRQSDQRDLGPVTCTIEPAPGA